MNNNFHLKGCKLCKKGAKLVLFVSGMCKRGCYYCPLSEERKQKQKSFANERNITNIEVLLDEVKRMRALGAGITGGEPLINMGKTLDFINVLKENFSSKFHIHLYTAYESNDLSKKLSQLNSAGLDEIRFHWSNPKPALDFEWDVAIEIPAIPNEGKKTKEYLQNSYNSGVKYINLNELDVSITNAQELKKRGFKIINGSIVDGSKELALKIIEWSKKENDLKIRFCSSKFKDKVQLGERYKRTSKNIARPFERITREGLLEYGIIEGNINQLNQIMKTLPKKFSELNEEKKRIETTPEIAQKFSNSFIILEYPTVPHTLIEKEKLM